LSTQPLLRFTLLDPLQHTVTLWEMTPDHHPILGESPEVRGFFFASGFSGHGVMHAPATGKILSDLILTGKTDLIDPSLLAFVGIAALLTILPGVDMALVAKVTLQEGKRAAFFTSVAGFQMNLVNIIGAVIGAAVLERYPNIRISFGESGAGWLALGLGVVVTLGLGIGLMALVFISSRRGYDDAGRKDD